MRLWLCGFLLLILSACAGGDSNAQTGQPTTTIESGAGGQIEVDQQSEFDELFADLAIVDLSLTRDDVVCDAFELGEDDVTEIIVGHYVVDGNLADYSAEKFDLTGVKGTAPAPANPDPAFNKELQALDPKVKDFT